MPKRYPPRRASLYDHSKEALRPVFGLDIDGTLGWYHTHFIDFGSFASYLGLSKATYRKIKLAYRRGGLKRSMPVRPGAVSLTASLRDRGALVILCTTRPYLSLENIDEDTRHWAKRNKIAHDAIIWGEHKYRELSRFGQRVVAVLDDDPALLRQADDIGIYSVKMLQPYNENVHWPTVANCEVAETYFDQLLTKWEEENL
jgi:hypothetical protein